MSRPIRASERGRRPDIETDLNDKYHVQWTYLHAVPTNQFDIDKSLRNQARFEALDEETAAIYQEGVERGDAFPAVLAQRQGRGANPKFVIIDGNHRLIAHERAGAAIDVYEVDPGTKAQTVNLMTYSFNTRHGKATSEEERVHSALYLIANGASLPEAAGVLNVPERVVRKAQLRAKGDARAKEVGVDMRIWDNLPQTARSRLVNISTDEGFHGAVELTAQAALTSEEVFELVQLLNESKSATRQRKLLSNEKQRFLDRIQASAGGVLATGGTLRAMSPRARLGTAIGQALALPDDSDALVSSYAETEREEIAENLIAISEKFAKMASRFRDGIQ